MWGLLRVGGCGWGTERRSLATEPCGDARGRASRAQRTPLGTRARRTCRATWRSSCPSRSDRAPPAGHRHDIHRPPSSSRAHSLRFDTNTQRRSAVVGTPPPTIIAERAWQTQTNRALCTTGDVDVSLGGRGNPEPNQPRARRRAEIETNSTARKTTRRDPNQNQDDARKTTRRDPNQLDRAQNDAPRSKPTQPARKTTRRDPNQIKTTRARDDAPRSGCRGSLGSRRRTRRAAARRPRRTSRGRRTCQKDRAFTITNNRKWCSGRRTCQKDRAFTALTTCIYSCRVARVREDCIS